MTSYLIERCQGVACATFAQIGTSATTTFNNTGLTSATSYSYRVRASTRPATRAVFAVGQRDDAGTRYAGADGARQSGGDGGVEQPDQSGLDRLDGQRRRDELSGRAVPGGRLLDLRAGWDVAPAPTFNNTGLAAATSYSYRVRATDAAGNLSAYSATAIDDHAGDAGDSVRPDECRDAAVVDRRR